MKVKKPKTKLTVMLGVRITQEARDYLDSLIAKGAARSYAEWINARILRHKSRTEAEKKEL